MSAHRIFPAAALALALSGAALAGGCGGDKGTSSSGDTTSSSSTGTSPPYQPQHTWTECQASDQAWVRRALFALDGRRGRSQAEINAWEDAVKAIRAADRKAAGGFSDVGDTLPPDGSDLENGKRLIAKAMMNESGYRERWSDFLLEALHINRIEIKAQDQCYGPPNPDAIDDGSLAAWVRDNDPSSQAPPLHDFTMGQLLSSALRLDDLSVLYRGNLFAMMNLPINGANVDFEAMERIRRQDFGAVFSSAYIHRDLVCLNCHNSEFSVTFDQDPAKNRAWPIPGHFEVALYGASNGRHPADEAMTKGSDELRAVSMLRVADVVDGSGQKPWGWASMCGRFKQPQVDDPLKIDAYFGSIRSTVDQPNRGLRASVWDLERALHRGVDLLAAHGLQRGKDGALADPDEAFAYLVAENIVEKVWDEVVGHRLTIANYFPRNETQRDILMGLTEHFVASHFSLQTLLLDILAHPAFNLKSPDEGCFVAPYEMPPVFDPWTIADSDLAKRGNSPADGVFAVSSRPLVRSLHRAMGWPAVDEYPQNDTDESFQVAVGFFIKDADPGFRGLDFQGRLTWETQYGGCPDLTGAGDDYIAHLVTAAQSTPGTTVKDAVVALKDRLVGDPTIDAAEQPDLEALIGAPLASTDLSKLSTQLRALCGVLVSTPQIMLGGVVPKDTRDVPKLTPPEAAYDVTCNRVSQYVMSAGAPYTVTCGGTTTVTHQ
jgi:hypothetical protein